MCLGLQQIILMLPQFPRTGSCQNLPQTKTGPLHCKPQTQTETLPDLLHVLSFKRGH